MSSDIMVRLRADASTVELAVTLDGAGAEAAAVFAKRRADRGVHLLVGGDRPYALTLKTPPTPAAHALLLKAQGHSLLVAFPGRRAVRRKLVELVVTTAIDAAPSASGALDLTAGLRGAAPLFLLPDGALSASPDRAPVGMDVLATLVTAARWVSSRRTSTFERLFPPSAFRPDEPLRGERLTLAQAGVLLAQLEAAIAVAKVGGPAAQAAAEDAAELRSAALTVLSHLVATVVKDPSFRPISDAAAAAIFALIEAEQGDPTARAMLRAHAILLLQLRGPALSAADTARATELLRGLIRKAPPYADLQGAWHFAMCSDYAFHAGECEVLERAHGFIKIEAPKDTPPIRARWGDTAYQVYQAPFTTPAGDPIQVFARSARPDDEVLEMGDPFFVGLLVNRHAQLGSFDLKASATKVQQQGYKLMINSQCAGLTTRFTMSRLFPDADLYTSWDSTYFRTEHGGDEGKVIASEGLDCFVAILEGMSRGQSHAEINDRVRAAQWSHEQALAQRDFVQFVGPAHPLVAARFNDVNQDGRADLYDGFFDFKLKAIAEDLQASITPRDPGVAASQLSGEAATGLNWAAGSMDRVTQYSDLWAGLPGATELFYAFEAGGFFSHTEPPHDIPAGKLAEDLGLLPAVTRYAKGGADGRSFTAEVLFHSFLAHAGKELKRLLVAADAFWRAVDLGYLPESGDLASLQGKRGMLLLTLAGLLEFPADQNLLDGLWSMALKALRLPDLSRSAIRAFITSADHDASNYYGSKRGLTQLLGALPQSDAVAFAALKSPDLAIGRAAPLTLP
ncbi:MAG: hypothetical protein ABI193_23130 [Minicystis sp.]